MHGPHFRVEPYEINTLECYKDFINHLKIDNTFNPPISKGEYYNRIRNTLITYARLKGFEDNLTELAKKHLFYIDCDYPSFTFWLAIKISISDLYEIPLMLDHFMRRSKASKNQFVNKIEFEVLQLIMKHNIFHRIDEKKIKVSDWIAERRKYIDPNEPDKKFPLTEPKPLDYNIDNLKYIEAYVDEHVVFDFSSLKLEYNAYTITETENFIDDRIECDTLNQEEIREYFMQLNRRNRKNDIILDKKDIDHLLMSNFKAFDYKDRKLLDPNISKLALMKFVYIFYLKIDRSTYKGRQLMFCRFLRSNFLAFKNDKVKVISKKLATAQPKYYPFDS